MIAPWPAAARPRLITRWASRASLAYPALAPGYAELDSRGLAGRVADMIHFARQVPFVNLGDVEEGYWDALFTGDDAILLALLSTMDVEGPRARADALIAEIRAARDPCRRERLIRELARLVLRLAARIDEWLGAAEGQAPGCASRRLFERLAADVLGPRLRRLLALVRTIEEADYFEEPVIVIVAECGSIWFAEIEVEFGPCEGPWLDRTIDDLLDSVTAFLAAALELVAATGEALESSLDEPVHAPQVGLLFAFASIFGHSADLLNALPARLAGFYRQEVLRADSERARPDRLFAALTPIPVPGAPPARIARGTAFPAGKDPQGKAVAFAADAPLAVTGARIGELRLWQVEGPDGGPARRLGAKSFPLPAGGAAGAAFAPGQVLPDAAIGLAIASPALELRSGIRQVTLVLDLLKGSIAASGATDELNASSCFHLSASTAKGWHPITDFSAWLVDAGESPQLRFSFILSGDFPPVAPPPASLPGMPAEAAVRLMLAGEAELPGTTALAMFGGALIAAVWVTVVVDSLGGLSVATPDGISAAGPGMTPFGTAPLPGAALRIEHPVFMLHIDTVSLEIDWNGLPRGAGGFKDYYRQYVVGPDRCVTPSSAPPLFENQSFTVTFRAPGDGDEDDGTEPLFDLTDGKPGPTSHFFSEVRGPGRALTLALAAPAYGVGDSLYAVNVAHAVAMMARRAQDRDLLTEILLAIVGWLRKLVDGTWSALKKLVRWKRDLIAGTSQDDTASEASGGSPSIAAAVPNPPWRAVAAALRVGYSARAALPALPATNPAAVFHVRAFGALTAVSHDIGGMPLLPPAPARGAFDLRISGWAGTLPLSILFLLGPSDPGAPRPGPVEWSYGGGEAWTPVPAGPDFADGTASLTATGILALPPLGTGGEDVWLRASFAGAPPPVARILPDALGATRIVTGDEAALAPVPPETLRSPAGLAGIARVEQPLASFGGAPAGGEEDGLQRIAERIGTRARGILGEDIERLALERFPGIARIRLEPAGPEPGRLRLIVVPAPGGPTPPDPVRPRAPASLREELRDWLASVSSPFARISVEDPVYATVDISIVAAFADPVADPDRLATELRALLSPWAEPGLDLDDGAGFLALEGAIVRFAAGRSYVASVVSVALSLPAPAAGWSVPVPGAIDILAISLPGGGC